MHTPSFTHNFVTHHLSTTILHTPSFTPSFTYHLSHAITSHTTLSHTICQQPSCTHHLSHTIFHTHHLSHTIFVTYHLSHTITSHTTLSRTICQQPSCTHHLSHTIFHTPSVTYHLCHIPSYTHNNFTHNFVTHHLSTTILHTPSFTHHLSHTICHIPSLSYTIFHTQLGTISHPASFCVAGVALMALCGALGRRWSPVTPRHFAWQAWHLVTSTFVSRGRRGTISHPPSFCVAGVALMALCGALGRRWSPVTPRHFPWQAWHNGHIQLRFAWQAWHNLTSSFVLRGRRGTYGTVRRAWLPLVAGDAAALCVAGVALGDIHLRFTWQAWRNLTSTFVLRGRRGTYGTVWRAWSLVAGDAAALCVAGVALGDIHLRFTWQAWHKETSPSFCVAGVALMALRGALGRRWSPVTPRHHIVTHHLCHTIFHTQLCHLPSFTYGFVTHHL